MKKFVIYLLLSLLAFAAIFPLIYTLAHSFIGTAEYSRTSANPFHLIPDWITLSGYFDVFISRPDYLVKFWISMFLSVTILAGQMAVAISGGYAFARFRFPGKNALFFATVLLMMLPYQVTLVPNYIVFDKFKLLDSYASLILPGIFSAFGVFLMRQVMRGIPGDIFEAARIDGAGSWRALWRVCLPNAKAGLAALVILNFADSWNMMEQPLAFLKNHFKYPLSLFLVSVNGANPALGFVCGILSILPLMLLFLFFKDEMIMGIEYVGGELK